MIRWLIDDDGWFPVALVAIGVVFGILTEAIREESDRACRIDRPHDATECDGYHLDLSDT